LLRRIAMDTERENVEVCILEPDDFPDDEEVRFESGEISWPGDDIRHFAERMRKGTHPIRGTKL